MRVDSPKASGRIFKLVVCEKCSCAYRYQLVRHTHALPFVNFLKMFICVLCFPLLFTLSFLRPITLPNGRIIYWLRFRPAEQLRDTMLTTLREGGEEYAHIANNALRDKLLKGVELVPCPDCGWLQQDMVEDIHSRTLPALDILGVVLLVASQVAALWFMDRGLVVGLRHLVLAWCLWTFFGFAAMFACMMLRWVLSARLNPNANYPAHPAPFPDAPPAIREAQRQKEVAANTAQLLGSIRKQEVACRPTAILPNAAIPGK